MLRPYKFKHHKIHKAQSFVNYIVLEILCKARSFTQPNFSSALVLPKYRSLIDDVNVEYILNPLTEAYAICRTLSRKDLNVLKSAVLQNNRIRELCNGEIKPVLYADIEKINARLSEQIKVFCDKLYDESINKAAFYRQFETIDAYYKQLVGRSSICRLCGINKVLTKFHKHRSALDHFLPRKYFPFASINFKNLVPICDTCNSKYKLGENPILKILNKGTTREQVRRVKAFYPFRTESPDIQISITFNKTFSSNIEPEDIEIELSCAGNDEQIESWDRLFGIKENYLAACCTDEMYNFYEEQYIADMNYGKSHDEYIDSLNSNKFADMNFLKIPFLEAMR